MFERINEEVSVLGIYQQRHFLPKRFCWRGRTHVVEEITLSTNVRDGGIRLRDYSITSGGTLYRLRFNRETEEWRLEELWVE